MIFVNFKTYRQGTGEAALKLARICREVSQETQVKIFPIVQTVDLRLVGNAWAQHADDIGYGPHTGQVLPEAIKVAGAIGVMLNHSERKLPIPVVGSTVARCQKLGLKTLVCCESLSEGQQLAATKPDFLAYEPPELIASRTDSVATAKPVVIKNFVEQIPDRPVLVGAGIKSVKDVKISLRLGARGVLIASSIVLSEEPRKALSVLAGVFKNG